jgi:ABC-2 type transport system permease protein
MPSLLKKTLRDWRRSIIGWSIGLAAFVMVYLSFWSSLHDTPSLSQLPSNMATAFGATDLNSGAGYLQGTVFGLGGPLLTAMAAILLGARAVARPEDTHTMDLYLANPISRRAFVVQRLVAMLIALLCFGFVVWLLTVLMVSAEDMGVSFGNVTAACVGMLLLGSCYGTLSLAVGAAVGRRTTALAVAGVFAVAGYMIRIVSQLASWAEPLRWLSPFHYYLTGDPLHHGFDVPHFSVLFIVSVVLAAAAPFAFDRRDVRV